MAIALPTPAPAPPPRCGLARTGAGRGRLRLRRLHRLDPAGRGDRRRPRPLRRGVRAGRRGIGDRRLREGPPGVLLRRRRRGDGRDDARRQAGRRAEPSRVRCSGRGAPRDRQPSAAEARGRGCRRSGTRRPGPGDAASARAGAVLGAASAGARAHPDPVRRRRLARRVGTQPEPMHADDDRTTADPAGGRLRRARAARRDARTTDRDDGRGRDVPSARIAAEEHTAEIPIMCRGLARVAAPAPAWPRGPPSGRGPRRCRPRSKSWRSRRPSASSRRCSPRYPGAREALSDDEIDRLASRVVERLSEKIVREIAWEVIPDVAELVIKQRIKELEAGAE